jgi:hypothetical protein
LRSEAGLYSLRHPRQKTQGWQPTKDSCAFFSKSGNREAEQQVKKEIEIQEN